MTFWCIEHLGRLPDELDLPVSAIRRAMLAYSIQYQKLRNKP